MKSKGFLSTAILLLIAGAIVLIVGIAMNGRIMFGELEGGGYGYGYWDGTSEIVLGIIFLSAGAVFFIVRAVVTGRQKQNEQMIDNREREQQVSGAAQGDAESMFMLGSRYYMGNGMEKDYAKAFENWNKAANAGHTGAMYELAGLYERGEGVAQDYGKALHWYREADSKGNADASVKVGEFYRDGKGGLAQNIHEAFRRFDAAAKTGNALGCYNLGICYMNGVGCDKDLALAKNYINRAAQSDLPEANVMLVRLMNSNTSAQEKASGDNAGQADAADRQETEDDPERTVLLKSANTVLVRCSTGEKIQPSGDGFVIGRSREKSSYRLDKPSVSSRHASFALKDGKLFVKDLGSSNHTYVNGNKLEIDVQMELKNGDMLKLADEEFRVETG